METLSHKLFRTSDIQKYKNQHHLIRVVLILPHKRERRVVSGKIPKCLLLMLMLSSRDSRDKKRAKRVSRDFIQIIQPLYRMRF